jgi:hypothetical protein
MKIVQFLLDYIEYIIGIIEVKLFAPLTVLECHFEALRGTWQSKLSTIIFLSL